MLVLLVIYLLCYLGGLHGAQHGSLFNSKTKSRPVVLRYKSDVSLGDDSAVEAEPARNAHHVSAETRAYLEAAPASTVEKRVASRQFTPTADIQEFYRDKLAVKITPTQRIPKTVVGKPIEQERMVGQGGLSNPSPTVIAKAPGLSSLLAEEETLIPSGAGSNFRNLGHNIVQKGSAIVSEIRSAVPKVAATSRADGTAAAGKPKVDVVGLTKQVLSPVLKKFFPSAEPSPSFSASSADPLSQKGLLDILKGLGQRITGGGFGQALPAFPQGASVRGPPVAGLPALPGLPGLKSQSNVDIMGLLSSIGKRIMEKTNITTVMQPNALQKMADNLTDALVPNMPELDLELFMGRWFEGVNSPRASEDRCIVHHFGGLTENGKTATYTALKIYREGSDFGQVRYSIGYAFRGGRQPGMLQMHSSESSDPVPFWIYHVGPVSNDTLGNNRYEYAVVSNWIRYPVTVLVRDPDTFKSKYEDEVLQWLETNHFINGLVRAFNLVQPVSYDNCRYSENAFEVLG